LRINIRSSLSVSFSALIAVTILGSGLLHMSFPASAEGLERIEDGQRIYRQGIRPSGDPITAIVTGDVSVSGSQFSCHNCHGRSGMGTSEGSYQVLPIAGRFLFSDSSQPPRPAYDQQSFARALRTGINPAGRKLDPLMPRYKFSDDEVTALASYLQKLSSTPPLGVDDKVIRLATVITDEVDEHKRDAFLSVLQTYVNEKNRQTRLESLRWNRGKTPASKLPTLYREWMLDIWNLKGPSSSWSKQLENRYKNNPVFAMMSGLNSGSWRPIGRFCERHNIPCLFPSTDLADADPTDFYTHYFSQGLDLEASLIAEHLATHPISQVVQIYCTEASEIAANNLRSTFLRKKMSVENHLFSCKDPLPLTKLKLQEFDSLKTAVILWLNREQLARFKHVFPTQRLYLSSTLLERNLVNLPISTSKKTLIAHPYYLPGQPDSAMERFKVWARTRDIDIRYPRIQSEAFFACFATNDALYHVRRYLLRDYMLDSLDHAQGLAAYVPVHPRATIGPDQRFLTKGGYLLELVDGRTDTENATWILP